jgi:hypothetical protein
VVDLPEPLGPEEAGHAAGLHPEGQVDDRGALAIALAEPDRLDDCHEPPFVRVFQREHVRCLVEVGDIR